MLPKPKRILVGWLVVGCLMSAYLSLRTREKQRDEEAANSTFQAVQAASGNLPLVAKFLKLYPEARFIGFPGMKGREDSLTYIYLVSQSATQSLTCLLPPFDEETLSFRGEPKITRYEMRISEKKASSAAAGNLTEADLDALLAAKEAGAPR